MINEQGKQLSAFKKKYMSMQKKKIKYSVHLDFEFFFVLLADSLITIL
jgi:hypothetical protein